MSMRNRLGEVLVTGNVWGGPAGDPFRDRVPDASRHVPGDQTLHHSASPADSHLGTVLGDGIPGPGQ